MDRGGISEILPRALCLWPVTLLPNKHHFPMWQRHHTPTHCDSWEQWLFWVQIPTGTLRGMGQLQHVACSMPREDVDLTSC